MRTFKLVAPEGTLALEGAPPDTPEPYGGWLYNATLDAHSLAARVSVHDHEPNRFAEFFLLLAKDWRGWNGERTFESLEHSLRITASHDNIGSVTITVLLKAGVESNFDWSASQRLTVEPSQLEKISNHAKEFAKVVGFA